MPARPCTEATVIKAQVNIVIRHPKKLYTMPIKELVQLDLNNSGNYLNIRYNDYVIESLAVKIEEK